MDRYPDSAGRVRPGAGIVVWGALLALELAFAVPAHAEKHDALDVPGIVTEFRQICAELDRARGDLGRGRLSDDAFADAILDLFVRADSLQMLLPRGGWIGRSGQSADAVSLARAFRYLTESLRDNYVGIASKNGVDFVEADRAYKAAVAWRPDFGATTATAAR